MKFLVRCGLAMILTMRHDFVNAAGWDNCDALKAQADLLSRINDDNYDRQMQPSAPVIVNTTYVIHDIVQVNEISRFIELQLTFYQEWFDDRLAVKNTTCDRDLDIPLPETSYDSIWTPSTRITNSISSVIVSSPYKVTTLTATPAGSVKYRVNIMTKQSCSADYTKFPFDTFSCSFVIGTWLPTAYIKTNWIGGKPVEVVINRVKLSTFAVGNYDYKDLSNKNVGGRYVVTLNMHRFYAYYVITVYFPNTLVILLAWASFWFVPSGMSCLISLTLMMNGIAGSLPKVGYVKGIDYWFLVCIFLVCLAFLEYAFLAHMERVSGDLDSPMPFRVAVWRRRKKESKMSVRDFSKAIDRIFRVVYLGGFVGFCIYYFFNYYRSMPLYKATGTDAEL